MNADKKIKEKIIKNYKKYLKRDPDNDEVEYHFSKIKNQQGSLEELDELFENSFEYQLIQKLNHSCVYTKFGTKMYLNKNDLVISLQLIKENAWEYEESLMIKEFLKKGMNVIDAGANIGYFTILFSKWIGGEGKVFAIEPESENFQLLVKNIKVNLCKNVIPIQKAISNFNGIVDMFLSEKNKGDHRILDFIANENDKNRKKIRVKCDTLDSIIPKEQKIDFIKMDIQGSEMLALGGMERILSSNPKIILFIEFWPFAIERSGFDPQSFIQKILNYRFKISTIKEGKKVPFLKENQKLENYSVDEFTNLICEKN